MSRRRPTTHRITTSILVAWMPRIVCAAALLTAAPRLAYAQDPAHAAETPRIAASLKSKDGTEIAYEREGDGPVLVLVASALADRSDAARLASLLVPSCTVVNYDRRGRGESGDTQPYAVRREVEDIEALIDAAGAPAYLFGTSSGAALALEAANALGEKVAGLIVYEPPFIVDDSRAPIPGGVAAEIDSLARSGRRSDAVARFMAVCVEVPEPMLSGLKQMPMWSDLEKRAHTLRYDFAVMAGLQDGKPLAKDRWSALSARALVMNGDRTSPYLRNSAKALAEVLPGAVHRTLEGQDHGILFMAPEALVAPIVEFVNAPPVGATKDGGKEARRGRSR
jgi:pimeloyl-ACP methyl ester carboxylesterase